jgi:hypothetical protein
MIGGTMASFSTIIQEGSRGGAFGKDRRGERVRETNLSVEN